MALGNYHRHDRCDPIGQELGEDLGEAVDENN